MVAADHGDHSAGLKAVIANHRQGRDDRVRVGQPAGPGIGLRAECLAAERPCFEVEGVGGRQGRARLHLVGQGGTGLPILEQCGLDHRKFGMIRQDALGAGEIMVLGEVEGVNEQAVGPRVHQAAAFGVDVGPDVYRHEAGDGPAIVANELGFRGLDERNGDLALGDADHLTAAHDRRGGAVVRQQWLLQAQADQRHRQGLVGGAKLGVESDRGLGEAPCVLGPALAKGQQ